MPADSDDPAQQFLGATVPSPPIADDDGRISPALREALTLSSRTGNSDSGETPGSGASVLAALVQARLFVPVVAIAEEIEVGDDGRKREKKSTMASVSIQDESGRRSLLAFTCIDELTRFNKDARPVPVAGPLAAQAALVEGAQALVIDVSGQAPFAVVGAELETLAASVGGGARNVGLRSALARHLRDEPDLVNAFLDPVAEDASACELVLVLPPSLTREEYQGLVARLSQRFAADRAVLVATTPPSESQHRHGLAIRVVAASDQDFVRQPGDTPSLV